MLILTEAGKKRRASMHLVEGEKNLAEFDRGGLEVLDASRAEFAVRLRSENHTIKRSLTDPTLFSGIGNAYSDEILHRAKLSPLLLIVADYRRADRSASPSRARGARRVDGEAPR